MCPSSVGGGRGATPPEALATLEFIAERFRAGAPADQIDEELRVGFPTESVALAQMPAMPPTGFPLREVAVAAREALTETLRGVVAAENRGLREDLSGLRHQIAGLATAEELTALRQETRELATAFEIQEIERRRMEEVFTGELKQGLAGLQEALGGLQSNVRQALDQMAPPVKAPPPAMARGTAAAGDDPVVVHNGNGAGHTNGRALASLPTVEDVPSRRRLGRRQSAAISAGPASRLTSVGTARSGAGSPAANGTVAGTAARHDGSGLRAWWRRLRTHGS